MDPAELHVLSPPGTFPIIHAGIQNPEIQVIPSSGGDLQTRTVEVTKRDHAQQAYVIFADTKGRPLQGRIWGSAYRGGILETDKESKVFTIPGDTPNPMELVMIKRLDWNVVAGFLHGNNASENPLNEIYRMQQIQKRFQPLHHDHINRFIPCIEALKTRDYLYIVTPLCLRDSLWKISPLHSDYRNRNRSNTIQVNQPDLEAEGRALYYFRQMLEAVQDLHRLGIAHRDIDPSNFFVTFNHQVRLGDFGMAFDIPQNGIQPFDHLDGKRSYMAPEIYAQMAYDPRQTDLWACVVCLYTILTGIPLYEYPSSSRDRLFHHWIGEGRLRDAKAFSKPLCELFYNALLPELNSEPSQRQRWTMHDIWECDWMHMGLTEKP